MKPINEGVARNECSPLDMRSENVDEEALIRTLKILIATGKINEADVLLAWKLGFFA